MAKAQRQKAEAADAEVAEGSLGSQVVADASGRNLSRRGHLTVWDNSGLVGAAPWVSLTDPFVIAVKSPVVIGKRMSIFARGGRSAKAEARTTVTENAKFAAESTTSLASGSSFASIVKRYQQRAEANARRL